MNRNSKTSPSAVPSFDELAPDLKQWVRETAHQYNFEVQEFVTGTCKQYGSIERGKIQMAMEDAWLKLEEEKCNEYYKRNPLPQPIMLGAKPSIGERVITVSLTDNIAIRIWGDKTACYHLFSFDFVDRAGRYIRTPPGIKIYSEATGLAPGGVEVHSIEESLKLSDVGGSLRKTVNKRAPSDPDWETYLIPEGTRLRITHPGHPDSFLDIPNRQPNGRVLQIPPYW